MAELKNETIVDRVVQRLKAAPLGDLITEEDLHDIVKQAIPKTFFEPRKVTEGQGYNQRVVDKEPVIFEIMRDLLKEEARKIVAGYMVDNAEKIAEYWKKVSDTGLQEYVEAIQRQQARDAVYQVVGNFMNRLNEERVRSGLPMLPLG